MPDELDARPPSTREIERIKLDKDALDWVMSTPQGRRFMWNTLASCRVYSTTFAGEATHSTAYNEGARSVGLQLLSAITQQVPRFYSAMISENQAAHEESDDARSS